MFKIILKSLRDIFTPTVMGFIFKVGIGSFLGWSIILYLSWDSFSSLIENLISMIPYIDKFNDKFEILKEGSIFIIALVTAYVLITATISALTSFYGLDIVAELAKKEYNVEARDSSSLTKSIYYTLKATIKFFALFILLLPIIIFVPIAGQIIMLFLWAVMLKEPTLYDVTSLFNRDFERYKDSKSLWIISIIASTFNYIPILNIFAPLFAYIMFMHYILSED
jgi:hypothetical protein